MVARAAVTTGSAPVTNVVGYFSPSHDSYGRIGVGLSSITAADATDLKVVGAYGGLGRSKPFFTVIYGNTNCDPAQAIVFGPFYSDAQGRATVNVTVPVPAAVGTAAAALAGAGSVSVRIGDTAADIDRDGKTGPTDVVAVPGTPAIGLVECNDQPVTG